MDISVEKHVRTTDRNQSSADSLFGATTTSDLKKKSVRGVAATVLSQGLTFSIQTGSTIVLARLLSPEDFGLQAMVVTMSGFLYLFRDAGLSVATVQREILTHEQTSTLFWVNVAVGAVLTIVAVAVAPFLVTFYTEPRLLLMTMASAPAFFFNSLAVQHRALLNRAMRFDTLAKVDVLCLGISAGVAVSLAATGYGYWALVAMTVSNPLLMMAGVWLMMPWRPGSPRRGSGVRSMLNFGAAVTLNGVVVYLAYNTEKILLGRFWGAEALGLYGRAYQLANLPVNQLNSAIGVVAYPALARVQNEADRLRTSFLKGYSIVVSLTIPVTITCAVFAEEIVRTLLGPKWLAAVPVLRLLSPTMLAFALINPFGWFLQATGRIRRSLNMAFAIAPVVILGVALGLPHGPTGVAVGYSVAMVALVPPLIAWGMHGTTMTAGDYINSIKRPVVAGVLAGIVGWLVKVILESYMNSTLVLLVGLTLTIGFYMGVLLIVMGQKGVYIDLLNQVIQRNPEVPAKTPERS